MSLQSNVLCALCQDPEKAVYQNLSQGVSAIEVTNAQGTLRTRLGKFRWVKNGKVLRMEYRVRSAKPTELIPICPNMYCRSLDLVK